jgi:hypothetical protein
MPILMTASSQTLRTLNVIEADREFVMPGKITRILNGQSFTLFSAIECRNGKTSKIPKICDSQASPRITANIFN